MTVTIFWSALVIAAYVYIGYPLLLILWSKVAPRPVRKRHIEPSVSIVIAMHDERDNVASKIQNCLDLDYPADKLEIIFSLDAPTDGTDILLRENASDRIKVLESPVRKGKAAAVNRGVAAATGEIVLLGDARQRFGRNVVRALVANFADDSVGAVSGELVVLDGSGKESADAVGIYWRYEKALRSMESVIHSVPGATGALYAIRRELFTPLPSKTVLDDVLTPMNIVLHGKRSVFEPAAHAYDKPTQSIDREYVRKRRTLMGNYELLAEMPELLAPWRNPIAVQFASHKAGRLIVPWCLAALLCSSLRIQHGFYLLMLDSQILFYLLAAAGLAMAAGHSLTLDGQSGETKAKPGLMRRAVMTAYTFLLMNWAAVAGLYSFIRGHEGFWNATHTAELTPHKEHA